VSKLCSDREIEESHETHRTDIQIGHDTNASRKNYRLTVYYLRRVEGKHQVVRMLSLLQRIYFFRNVTLCQCLDLDAEVSKQEKNPSSPFNISAIRCLETLSTQHHILEESNQRYKVASMCVCVCVCMYVCKHECTKCTNAFYV
jgi:hypothetical protein